jgi:hypothetical protein
MGRVLRIEVNGQRPGAHEISGSDPVDGCGLVEGAAGEDCAASAAGRGVMCAKCRVGAV